ncbi:MAG: Gfo/Idh/MocA family oxidoreductase [Cyanobacteria bacterium REEB65]|nr:Gfo/Idh/MocA family oxidoreductase [Cyanobacteria bacterium REEB65]
MNVGVVGSGYWGPNLIRNLHELGALAIVCDLDEQRLAEVQERYGVRTTRSYTEVLAAPDIAAVVLSTPVPTHHELALQALAAGKHVFVEKPLALTAAEAEELVESARRAGLVLLVGHLLEYHPAFLALRDCIAAGDLGELRHLRCSRLNLGKLREAENVLWSFAPHDLSQILRLARREPLHVSATGRRLLGTPREDTVYADLDFGEGLSAHLHVSWLEPQKLHQLVVVGSRKMAVFNDSLSEGKLRIYDRGFDDREGRLAMRSGAETIVPLATGEPMRRELEDFLECCRTGARPLADGISGLWVVRTLERISQCLSQGEPVDSSSLQGSLQ